MQLKDYLNMNNEHGHVKADKLKFSLLSSCLAGSKKSCAGYARTAIVA